MVTNDEIACLEVDQLVMYDEQTDRLMAVALSEVEQAASLLDQAMAVRLLADRWVELPGQGRKQLAELTGEELQTLANQYQVAHRAVSCYLKRLSELAAHVRC